MCLSVFRFKCAKRYRHFARFDEQGRCIAFKSCERIPTLGNWVQVDEINLAWLSPTQPQADLNALPNDNAVQATDRR